MFSGIRTKLFTLRLTGIVYVGPWRGECECHGEVRHRPPIGTSVQVNLSQRPMKLAEQAVSGRPGSRTDVALKTYRDETVPTIFTEPSGSVRRL